MTESTPTMPLVRTTRTAGAGPRAQREAAYLDAAEELVAAGTRYADLAVAEIAGRAGFSRASFYAYFTDKRALAVRIGDRFRGRLTEAVGGWLRGEDDGTLRDALERMLDLCRAHRGAVLLIAEAAAYDPELAAFWRTLHAEFERLAGERLRLDRPDLPAATRRARAFTVVWSTQATVVEHLASGRPPAPALADSLAVMWEAVLDS